MTVQRNVIDTGKSGIKCTVDCFRGRESIRPSRYFLTNAKGIRVNILGNVRISGLLLQIYNHTHFAKTNTNFGTNKNQSHSSEKSGFLEKASM